MKTKQFISILVCIASLCSTTLLPAYADESKKKWDPIRKKNDMEVTIPEEGYFLVVVVDTATGEIIEDASGYYPTGIVIPIPPASSGEVLLIQPIPFPYTIDTIY